MRARVAFVGFASLLLIAAAAGAQQDDDAPRLVTVTGVSEIWVEPDEAVLSFGVSSRAQTLEEAQRLQEQEARKVLAAIQGFGVAEKDVQTSRLQMGPEYEYENQRRKQVGYRAAQTFTVILRDLTKYELLLPKLLQSGVDEVHGIQFRLANPRKHADQARAEAVRAAKEKAAALAGELGAKIGRPYRIEEHETGDAIPLQANVMMRAEAAGPESTIAAGQIRVSARVTVSFELQ